MNDLSLYGTHLFLWHFVVEVDNHITTVREEESPLLSQLIESRELGVDCIELLQ
jgi:hypothetical protein